MAYNDKKVIVTESNVDDFSRYLTTRLGSKKINARSCQDHLTYCMTLS